MKEGEFIGYFLIRLQFCRDILFSLRPIRKAVQQVQHLQPLPGGKKAA